MCNDKDAERYEELAKLQEMENDKTNARKNYLEAASIFVLLSQKDEKFLGRANECYNNSRKMIGDVMNKKYTKEQLAKRTLDELKPVQSGKKNIMAQINLAKQYESTAPEMASRKYLEAADMLLKESYNEPSKEKEYIELANKVYLKAKEIKMNGFAGTKDGKTKFSDIGGLEELKEDIQFKIIQPMKKPDLFKYYNKSIGGGILMYGPPGCGKSLIARATANEADVMFIHVKGSDLRSKYVGETEKNIAELFEKARKHQPTIIFFDEFEVLGGDRTESQAHDKSAVAQLLTEMDGMDSKDQQILLLAATNEPWSIDPALRREGRFGNTLFIPPPDHEARKHIFKIHLNNRPIENINYDKLAKLSEGLSGADIKGACEMATNIPLRESIRTGKIRTIVMDDLEKGIKGTESVLKQWYKKACETLEKKDMEESFKELFVSAGKVCG